MQSLFTHTFYVPIYKGPNVAFLSIFLLLPREDFVFEHLSGFIPSFVRTLVHLIES